MAQQRQSQKQQKKQKQQQQKGSGYLAPAEWFNPEARQPSGNSPLITSAPEQGWVRPPMSATMGGKRQQSRNSRKQNSQRNSQQQRNSRKQSSNSQQSRSRGGFAPAIMGSFVSNAHSVVVPLVLAGAYALLGEKKTAASPVSNSRNSRKGGKSSKSNKSSKSSSNSWF
jgi:hypothetical protein